MSDFPQLVEAEGDILADDKLFRVGSFKVWAEIASLGDKPIAVHDIQLNYSIEGVPTASVLLGVGLPFGPEAEDYLEIQASLDSVKRGHQVLVKIEVLEQTFDDNDLLGAMLPGGTFLLFDGVVGGHNIQTAEDSRDIGLSLHLIHRTGLRMSANTTIFGPYPPGSLEMETLQATYQAEGEAQNTTSSTAINIWEDWIINNLRWVLTPGRAFKVKQPAALDIFSEYKEKQVQYFEEALENTTGDLPLRSEEGGSVAARRTISKFVTDYIKRGAQSVNALSLITQLGQEMFFNIIGTASQLYVFPYWPYRKIREMFALKAGSFVVTDHKETSLSQRGSFVGGTAIVAPTLTIYKGVKPQSGVNNSLAYKGSYRWDGFEDAEKQYVTIDIDKCPSWLLHTYVPNPPHKGDPQREDYASPKPVHAPGPSISTDEKLNNDVSIYEGAVDRLARFFTLEKIMQADMLDVYTPLRFDITPGKVLRLDQTTIGRKRSTTEEEALYGHVHSVMLRINAVSKTAGVRAVISHVHNHEDQGRVEEGENGPVAYEPTYYDALAELQLIEEVQDEAAG